MKPYPPNIPIQILERTALESLPLGGAPELSPEYLNYAGTIDVIKEVQLSNSSISYVLRRTPGIRPHTAIAPHGRIITVKLAGPRQREYEVSPALLEMLLESEVFNSIPSYRLYAGGLPYEMSDTALLKLFNKYGSVQAVSIVTERTDRGMRAKGFGFVRMSGEKEAQSAIEGLDNREILASGEPVSEYVSSATGDDDEPYDNKATVMNIVETASRELAKLISYEPGKLKELEWRDLERMLAVVFDGIGYAVRLTRSAKDGGKDIILEFIASRQKQSYYVEVKHWVSGQKVGRNTVREFLSVVVRDRQQGGVLISTSGFSASAMEGITEIERRRLRLGNSSTVVSLCRTYIDVSCGLMNPVNFTDMLISVTGDGIEPDGSG